MTFIHHPPLYMGDTSPEEEDTNSSETVSISVLSDFGDTEMTRREVIGEEERDDEADDEDDEDDENDDDESSRAKRIR